jgi:two-component system, cell cycle response regulator DivK
MNILIVDDSRFLRMANERALTRAGYSVICASDGEEGLRLARERQPDLVVLDMRLPKISGPELLRALRKDPGTALIPIMVLTSLPQCNEEKFLSEGATAYFEKSLLVVDKGPGPFLQAVKRLLLNSEKSRAANV